MVRDSRAGERARLAKIALLADELLTIFRGELGVPITNNPDDHDGLEDLRVAIRDSESELVHSWLAAMDTDHECDGRRTVIRRLAWWLAMLNRISARAKMLAGIV